MAQIVAITGAGAGVERATARKFARQGYDVALIGRDQALLAAAAADIRAFGQRAGIFPADVADADVADADAVDAAAEPIEAELCPIDVRVNNAMVTIFGPVREVSAAEFKRATEVTCLGTVHGVQSALKRMRTRKRGTIINVGSALAYRSVPLQAPDCAAKSAIRGFTDSLRSEIIHDGYSGQLTDERAPGDGEGGNLFEPVAGDHAARGRFSNRSRNRSWEIFSDRHKDALVGAGAGALVLGLATFLARRAGAPG